VRVRARAGRSFGNDNGISDFRLVVPLRAQRRQNCLQTRGISLRVLCNSACLPAYSVPLAVSLKYGYSLYFSCWTGAWRTDGMDWKNAARGGKSMLTRLSGAAVPGARERRGAPGMGAAATFRSASAWLLCSLAGVLLNALRRRAGSASRFAAAGRRHHPRAACLTLRWSRPEGRLSRKWDS